VISASEILKNQRLQTYSELHRSREPYL